MDLMELDAFSAVLGAIAASAEAGGREAVKDMTKSAIAGTRGRLIQLVRRRLADDELGNAKLTVYTADPTEVNGKQLHGHLVEAGIDEDQEILALARELLQAAGPTALAPGSVAANVINQNNKEGGKGFIGGHHNHYGAAVASQVNWELSRLQGDGYELRNVGTAAAVDVVIDANVEITPLGPNDRDVSPGSSLTFVCSPSLADPTPVVAVSYTSAHASGRQRWQRPIPR